MSDTEDRINIDDRIREIFEELRRYYKAHRDQIDSEVIYMTGRALHHDGSEPNDCACTCRRAGYYVFDGDADVISGYLRDAGEVMDLGAEAIVRRLCGGGAGICEKAHFNSWLDMLGYEPLTEKSR